MKQALIIIDMQNFFLKHMSPKNKKTLIEKQLTVIRACRKANLPIIALEYACLGIPRGHIVAKLHEASRPQVTIVKQKNGGFTQTNLDQILKDWGVGEVVLIGINGSGCVQDTAIGALHRNYKVVTCLETMANTWRNDLKLTDRNTKWYQANTRLFQTTDELINHIQR